MTIGLRACEAALIVRSCHVPEFGSGVESVSMALARLASSVTQRRGWYLSGCSVVWSSSQSGCGQEHGGAVWVGYVVPHRHNPCGMRCDAMLTPFAPPRSRPACSVPPASRPPRAVGGGGPAQWAQPQRLRSRARRCARVRVQHRTPRRRSTWCFRKRASSMAAARSRNAKPCWFPARCT